MGTKNYVVDDRCIVPPEIKMLSAAELAEKIAEYVQESILLQGRPAHDIR